MRVTDGDQKMLVAETVEDPPHKLLRFIWLLSKSDESKEIKVSQLFDRILDFSSKGYLDYGFKPGKWTVGRKEFVIRSQGFVSDLGFLARQGYIQIDNDSDTVKLLPEGEMAAKSIKLAEKLEHMATMPKA